MTLRSWLEGRAELLPARIGAAHLSDAEREIAALRRPPTARAFDEATAASLDVTRYRLHGRRLWRFPRVRPEHKAWLTEAEYGFERMTSRLLGLLPDGVELPPFDFAVNLGDYPVRGAPIFTSWSPEGFGNVRMPNPLHWERSVDVPLRDERIRAHRHFDADALARPWRERANRVVWRGSATGMYDSSFRFARLRRLLRLRQGAGLARLELCRLSARRPELLDARITGWPQLSERVRRLVEDEVPTGPKVDRSWYLAHRYIVNVDGNVGTASFLSFLGAGTVVLKQESPYRDWCAEHLRAGEHYLAFAADPHDLPAVAAHALEHPAVGARVEEAGRRFSARFLTGTSVDFRLLALLDRYAGVAPVASEPGSDWILCRP